MERARLHTIQLRQLPVWGAPAARQPLQGARCGLGGSPANKQAPTCAANEMLGVHALVSCGSRCLRTAARVSGRAALWGAGGDRRVISAPCVRAFHQSLSAGARALRH